MRSRDSLNDGLDKLVALETQRPARKIVGFKIVAPTELQYPTTTRTTSTSRAPWATTTGALPARPWLIARALRAEETMGTRCGGTGGSSTPPPMPPHTTRSGPTATALHRVPRPHPSQAAGELTDPRPIAAYETRSVQPHAIARLRPARISARS